MFHQFVRGVVSFRVVAMRRNLLGLGHYQEKLDASSKQNLEGGIYLMVEGQCSFPCVRMWGTDA